VKSQRKRWRERGERKARWFELPKAAKIVQEPGLRRLLRKFDDLIPTGRHPS
jgi:hypothetical protein